MSFNYETKKYEGYIYKIVNNFNSRVYIGQTITTLKDRWHGHMSAAINQRSKYSTLYSAMNYYGRENFHIEEIVKVQTDSKEELKKLLDKLEIIFIKKYKAHYSQNGYNVENGGNDKRVKGRVVCKYDLELNLIEKYDSCEEAGRQNNLDGATIYGVCTHSYFHAGGFIWAFEGEKPITSNSKRYTFKYNLEERSSLELHEKQKQLLVSYNELPDKIVQYNSYGEIVNIFDNFIEAVNTIPIKAYDLRNLLSGKRGSYHNYIYRYINDSFDKYPIPITLKAITVYDKQGQIIKHFPNQKEAEKWLGCAEGDVGKTIKRGGACKGYLLSEYGKPIKRKTNSSIRKIQMFNQSKQLIEEFSNSREVSAFFNVRDCHKSLLKAIKNNTLYRGYYWKYEDEFPIND